VIHGTRLLGHIHSAAPGNRASAPPPMLVTSQSGRMCLATVCGHNRSALVPMAFDPLGAQRMRQHPVAGYKRP
jgi:hypothetical protein